MSVYIIQCLCPNRHAIYGIAYDPKDMPHDVAMAVFQQQIEEWIATKTINPWCGICAQGEKSWTYEQRRTKYKTMEEAKPELKALELEMMLSRMVIDASKENKN